jgi:hypothetical protein
MSTKLRTKDAQSDWLAPKLRALSLYQVPITSELARKQHTPILTVRTIAAH